MLIQKKLNKQNLLDNYKKLDAKFNAKDTAGNDQSMFVVTILEKIKETRLEFS